MDSPLAQNPNFVLFYIHHWVDCSERSLFWWIMDQMVW